MNPLPTLQTQVVLLVFFFLYIAYLIRSASRNRIDIYDLLALSCVASLPLIFGMFPKIMLDLSHSIGVTFPFVVLFGALFVVNFAYLHRLLKELNRQTRFNKQLIQEISMLKADLENGALLCKRTEDAGSQSP